MQKFYNAKLEIKYLKVNKMEELSSTLKFIGQIRRDEKINTKHLTVTPNTLKTSFYRTFFENESRQTTLMFLQNNLYKAVQILDDYAKKKPDMSLLFVKSLVVDLIGVKDGINNLRQTYIDDRIFTCHLDTMKLYVDSFLFKLHSMTPDLFPDGFKPTEATSIHSFSDLAFENFEFSSPKMTEI